MSVENIRAKETRKYYDTLKYGSIGIVTVFKKNHIDTARIIFSSGKMIEISWIDFAFYAIGLTSETKWFDMRKFNA